MAPSLALDTSLEFSHLQALGLLALEELHRHQGHRGGQLTGWRQTYAAKGEVSGSRDGTPAGYVLGRHFETQAGEAWDAPKQDR